MHGLILSGGKAASLRPLTVYTPKPLVPVCNHHLLSYQIELLKGAGVSSITLGLSYQPTQIEQVFSDGTGWGVHLNYSVEPQPFGTAGALKKIQHLLSNPVVVLNGDIITDLDLAAVIRAHDERKAAATVVLTPVENPSAYGLVERHEDGRVKRFLEKPKPDEISVNTINAGTYVLDPRVLDYIPAGENYSFEYGLFPDLLRREESFYAYVPTDAYWIDIGTPARYLQAHLDLLAGRVRGVHVDRPAADAYRDGGAEIDALSLVGADCVVKPGAQIVNSVLGEGCHIEEKASVVNSVVWPHTRIAAGAHVAGAVIGRGCHVGRAAHINGAVVGDKSSLTDYTQLGGPL